MKKRWLKRKGCKNVALVTEEYLDEDGYPYTKTFIQPYYKGREFVYLSPVFKSERVMFHNVYFDRKTGTAKLIKPHD